MALSSNTTTAAVKTNDKEILAFLTPVPMEVLAAAVGVVGLLLLGLSIYMIIRWTNLRHKEILIRRSPSGSELLDLEAVERSAKLTRKVSQFDLNQPGDYTSIAYAPEGNATTTLVDSQPLSVPGFLEITKNDIRQGQNIGKGGSGTLYLCELLVDVDPHMDSESQYAIKIMKSVTSLKSERQLATFQQEIAIMYHFSNHPNFVKFTAYTNTPRAIIMKYYPQGSLTKLISRKSDAPIDKWAITCNHLAVDILLGLHELHRNQIVHNDIKPGNILIEKDKQLRRYVALLCDFSISSVNGTALMGVKEFHSAKVRGASWAYASPEVLRRLYIDTMVTPSSSQEDNYKVDIYSFAVSIYEALTRQRAWGKKAISKDFAKSIVDGLRPDWSKEIMLLRKVNGQCRKLCETVEGAWREDPKQRPTAEAMAKKLKA